VDVRADPRRKRRKIKVDPRYVGFLPTDSDIGPANRDPEPMPNKYIAVERFSATWDTPNSRLASSLAGESAEPAHAWVNIKSDNIAMFLDLDASDQFFGSMGSVSPVVLTQMCSFSVSVKRTQHFSTPVI